MQSHLEEPHLREMSCPAGQPGNFALKDGAGQQGEPERGRFGWLGRFHDFCDQLRSISSSDRPRVSGTSRQTTTTSTTQNSA